MGVAYLSEGSQKANSRCRCRCKMPAQLELQTGKGEGLRGRWEGSGAGDLSGFSPSFSLTENQINGKHRVE